MLLERIRGFFRERGVLEVETPVCSAHANPDPATDPLHTRINVPGMSRASRFYLQTSPEFAMKRLLAAGSGAIFQVCKVFRNAERGGLHTPEFSLLEWYRPGFGLHDLMREVAQLVEVALEADWVAEQVTYGALFEGILGIDPHAADADSLRQCARDQGIEGVELGDDRNSWLDLLMTHCIEPRLPAERMIFVYDYPAGQAALARVRAGAVPVAERFELYLSGIELANGFHELDDPVEQNRRFQQDLRVRGQRHDAALPVDPWLLDALSAGLPDCSGVALGLDRLLMVLSGAQRIDQVLAFPLERA